MSWLTLEESRKLADKFSGMSFTLDDAGLTFRLGQAPRVVGFWGARIIGRSFQGHWNAVNRKHAGRPIQRMFRRSWRYEGWPDARRPELMLTAPPDAWRRVFYQGIVRSKAAIGLEFGETVRAGSGYLRIPVANLRIWRGVARSWAKRGDRMQMTAGRAKDEFVLKRKAGLVVLRKLPNGSIEPVALLRKSVKLPEKLKLREVWKAQAGKRAEYVRWGTENIAKALVGKITESAAVNALMAQAMHKRKESA